MLMRMTRTMRERNEQGHTIEESQWATFWRNSGFQASDERTRGRTGIPPSGNNNNNEYFISNNEYFTSEITRDGKQCGDVDCSPVGISTYNTIQAMRLAST